MLMRVEKRRRRTETLVRRRKREEKREEKRKEKREEEGVEDEGVFASKAASRPSRPRTARARP